MITMPFYFPEAVRCSRVEHDGRYHTNMEAADPSGWSISDIITVSGILSGLGIWLWKKPIKKLWNMWQAPDRIAQMDKKLDFILAGVNLAMAMSQVTWQLLARPVWQADANGMTVHINPFMLKLLGRQDDEILGDGWVNIVHEDDRERVRREWRSAIENKRDFHLHYRWVSSSGETINIVGQASRLLDTKGNILGWVGFASIVD